MAIWIASDDNERFQNAKPTKTAPRGFHGVDSKGARPLAPGLGRREAQRRMAARLTTIKGRQPRKILAAVGVNGGVMGQSGS